MAGGENIVLIGMPGSGKSTVGVVLAKTLGMDFVDVDLLICRREDCTLQEILDRRGLDAFAGGGRNGAGNRIPGYGNRHRGSVPMSEKGYGASGAARAVHLSRRAVAGLERRIHNITTRGIAFARGRLWRISMRCARRFTDAGRRLRYLWFIRNTP